MTPEIIKMTEGEARLRTISERLYSHSDRRLATALDSISDQIAENFWKAEDKATEQSSIATVSYTHPVREPTKKP